MTTTGMASPTTASTMTTVQQPPTMTTPLIDTPTPSMQFNLSSILNPPGGKSPQAAIYSQQSLAAGTALESTEYSSNGAGTYVYDGPLNLWRALARPMRLAMMGNSVVPIFAGTPLQFAPNAFAASSIPVIIAMVVCGAMALVSLLQAPGMLRTLYRTINRDAIRKRKEAAEAEEMRQVEQAAAQGLTARDLEKEKEKKMREKKRAGVDDEDALSDKIRIYSLQQRVNAVVFLLIVLGTNMACLIVATVATAQGDNTFADFRNLAMQSMASLYNKSAEIGSKTADLYSVARMTAYGNTLRQLDLEPYNQQVFPSLYNITMQMDQTMNDLANSYQWYQGNVSAVQSQVSQISSLQAQLNALLSNPLPSIVPTALQSLCPINPQQLPTALPYSLTSASISELPSINYFQASALTNGQLNQNFLQRVPIISSNAAAMFQAANQGITNNTLNQLKSYAQQMQVYVPTAYRNVTATIQQSVYQSLVALNVGAEWLAMRSNGAYVSIMFSFFATLASALFILFGQWRLLKFLNVCHTVLLAAFWIICGVSLGYAYVNAHVCNAATEQFYTWAPGLQAMSGDSNTQSYINQMFSARASCIANNSVPLVQLANQYSSSRLTDTNGVADMQYGLNISLLASTLTSNVAGSAVNAYISSMLSLVQPWLLSIINTQPQMISATKTAANAIVSAPISQYYSAAAQPVLVNKNAISDAVASLTSYSVGVNPSYFNVTGSSLTAAQCSSQFASSYSSNIVGIQSKSQQLVGQLTSVQAQMAASVSNIATTSAAIQGLTSQLVIQLAPFPYNVTQRDISLKIFNDQLLAINSQTVTTFLQPVMLRVAADIQSLIPTLVDCHDIGVQLSKTEPMCQASLVGMDASYWAFGALAVLCFLQLRAFAIASNRLKEDSRWLMMAMLLRQNNTAAAGGQTKTRITRKVKTNQTGTTYLADADFDVSFDDPTLAHTRV